MIITSQNIYGTFYCGKKITANYDVFRLTQKKNDELNLPLSEFLERYSIWKALTAYTNTF